MGTVGTDYKKTSIYAGLAVPTTVPIDDWRCEQIERKEYLEWCRDCAVLPKGMFGIRQNIPENRKVVFGGIPYYPQGYLLEFDANGQVVHTAVLHDLKANSVTRCPLDKVGKYLKWKEATP